MSGPVVESNRGPARPVDIPSSDVTGRKQNGDNYVSLDKNDPASPQEHRVIGKIRDAVASAHEERPELVVAQAQSVSAMKIVALLTHGEADYEFSCRTSQKNWDEALGSVLSAQDSVINTLQRHMGPAAAAILMAKIIGVICRTTPLPGDKILRLCRHFMSAQGTPGHLPIDQALELGAEFCRRKSEQEDDDYGEE